MVAIAVIVALNNYLIYKDNILFRKRQMKNSVRVAKENIVNTIRSFCSDNKDVENVDDITTYTLINYLEACKIEDPFGQREKAIVTLPNDLLVVQFNVPYRSQGQVAHFRYDPTNGLLTPGLLTFEIEYSDDCHVLLQNTIRDTEYVYDLIK